MAVEIKLQGVDELNGKLRKLPAKLRTKHLKRALRQGSALVRDEIKRIAPIRPQLPRNVIRPKPGRLRRLVRVKARRGKKTYIKASIFYPKQGTKNDPKNAFYWRFVEFGTRYTAAQPYISVSVDRQFNPVVRRFLNETNRGVSEELRNLKANS